MASNNGNWQWSAGTGCDAAPYFEFLILQSKLKNLIKIIDTLINVTDLNDFTYPKPMVDHPIARNRAVETYKKA